MLFLALEIFEVLTDMGHQEPKKSPPGLGLEPRLTASSPKASAPLAQKAAV